VKQLQYILSGIVLIFCHLTEACPSMPAGPLTNSFYGIESVLSGTGNGFQIRRRFEDIDHTIYYRDLGGGRVESNAPANEVSCRVFNGKMAYVEDFGLPFGSSGFTNYLAVTTVQSGTVVTTHYECNGSDCRANGTKEIYK